MQYTSIHFFKIFILLLILSGCNEEPELSVLQKVAFQGPITVSPENIVITAADSSTSVVQINWPSVDYFREVPVTYSIQFTTSDDVTTWAKAYELPVGINVLTNSLTGKELNKIVADFLGIIPETKGEIAIRIKSYVDRAAYSAPVTIHVTPYKLTTSYASLWIAGDFQGWDITNARTIASVKNDGIYEGYIFIPPGGTNEFKLYAQPDWGPVSYGTINDGTIHEANFAGDNFKAPSDGYYLFAVDLNTNIYLLIKTTWGMIGAATPGGWTTDTDMDYNTTTQSWSVTLNLLKNGSFKFRANHAWQLDFGIDGDAHLIYANHPWKVYVDQPQLTVPDDGNYTVLLDLHEPGNYTYQIHKN
ncbi:MAG: SusE domain-containing protein [Saprospiraceae bacterium]